jgi:hypothetical protein
MKQERNEKQIYIKARGYYRLEPLVMETSLARCLRLIPIISSSKAESLKAFTKMKLPNASFQRTVLSLLQTRHGTSRNDSAENLPKCLNERGHLRASY